MLHSLLIRIHVESIVATKLAQYFPHTRAGLPVRSSAGCAIVPLSLSAVFAMLSCMAYTHTHESYESTRCRLVQIFCGHMDFNRAVAACPPSVDSRLQVENIMARFVQRSYIFCFLTRLVFFRR